MALVSDPSHLSDAALCRLLARFDAALRRSVDVPVGLPATYVTLVRSRNVLLAEARRRRG